MNSFMYTASVPVFKQMLASCKAILMKAEAHAAAKNIDAQVFLQGRLAPDMFSLMRQVQVAGDFAKGTAARLAGVAIPEYQDTEVSFADLYARIDKTVAFIDSLTPAQFDGSETREIVLRPGTPKEMKFVGQPYLLHYAIPQFFFHITSTYGILRHLGLEIGKKDYMGQVS